MVKVYRRVWEGNISESSLTSSDAQLQDDLKVQEKQVSTPGEKRATSASEPAGRPAERKIQTQSKDH
jgi:hypothetical protein